jgi:hypothetical protein
MRILALACAMFIFSSSLTAQKDVPAFGKYSDADRNVSKVTYDDGAGAVCLYDVGETYCSFILSAKLYINTTHTRHVRIKILDKKGLSQADVSLQYASGANGQTVKKLTAQTVNFNDHGEPTVTRLDKSMIFDKKKTKRVNEITLAFPEVREGSVIEYQYEIESPGITLMPWYFQHDIPVQHSRYTIDFPYELKIAAQPQGIYQVRQETKEGNSRYKRIFSIDSLPGLRNEAYISNPRDYMQKVTPYMVSLDLPNTYSQPLHRQWNQIVKDLMEDEDFGVQLKKNIPRTSDLDAMLKGVDDDFKKMEIIHHYVRSNMHWNDIEGIWAMEGVKSAWKEKKGTTGEINLILVNLLKDAGLKASPMLVSTHDNGMVDPAITEMWQFNSVMAYVTIGNRFYVLDATDKYTPVHLIPESVLYSQGLAIEKYETYEWGWKQIFDNNRGYTTMVNVFADIDPNDNIKGSAIVRADDYERVSRTEYLKDDKERYPKSYFRINDSEPEIDSLEIENTDNENEPLIHRFTFKHALANSGDYHFINANMFAGMDKNPFTNDERISDVMFRAKQTYIYDETFTIPDGFVYDATPKNMMMRMPDSSIIFKRQSVVDGKTLKVRLELNFNKPVYGYEDYDYFHEFYKKLFSLLNEQYVFKKA